MFLSDEQLQEKRTPADLQKFVKDTFEYINSDKDLKKQARLKKDNFKIFIEETYPLSIFCNEKYRGQNILCFSVVGNQGYDAIIETDNGTLKEIVELTWPIDGQKDHIERLQLNEKKITDCKVWDDADNSNQLEAIEIIMSTAHKKALKDYEQPEGSSLVFVLNIFPYFGMEKVDKWEDIEYLIKCLNEIDYKVGSVYILLLPIGELILVKTRQFSDEVGTNTN